MKKPQNTVAVEGLFLYDFNELRVMFINRKHMSMQYFVKHKKLQFIMQLNFEMSFGGLKTYIFALAYQGGNFWSFFGDKTDAFSNLGTIV